MLSRKYYRKIAEILGRTNAPWKTVVEFQEMALKDNPRFDAIRFGDAVEKAKLSKVV